VRARPAGARATGPARRVGRLAAKVAWRWGLVSFCLVYRIGSGVCIGGRASGHEHCLWIEWGSNTWRQHCSRYIRAHFTAEYGYEWDFDWASLGSFDMERCRGIQHGYVQIQIQETKRYFCQIKARLNINSFGPSLRGSSHGLCSLTGKPILCTPHLV
jgi:hypothetical protein